MAVVLNLIFDLLVISPIIIYMFLVPRMVHMMQLEGYKFKDYTRWLGKNLKNAFWPGMFQLIVIGAYGVFVAIINYILFKTNINNLTDSLVFTEYICMVLLFVVINVKQIIKDKKLRKNAKKKLVYTARAKRLMFWNFALIILTYASYMPNGEAFQNAGIVGASLYYMLMLFFFTVMVALIPINVAIGNFLAYPTEAVVQDYYESKARKKIKSKKFRHLIRIGITGSYGKTSTKCILKTILSEKYNVYATPESYNTTMGNVKVINNELKPEHEVFISEMGARYRRDISDICEFVMPQIGIITSIGPQHLESFGSIEKIVKTKSELLRALPSDGVVVLPRDNDHCQRLYSEETREKICYTIKNSNADVYAKDVVLDENGCSFTAHTSIGKIKCVTKLLGEHNVMNILGCIAIAVRLGLTVEQIEAGVSKIEPVPHRLQILDGGNGTIVIDDAFNSNPVGSKMALDVLSKFKGRKIIVTPGMVELGDNEEAENKKFGKNMSKVVDIAILVGIKRSKPIQEGLREGKFDNMNIYVVADLEQATKKLAELTKKGDVILFENDLPDNYNE